MKFLSLLGLLCLVSLLPACTHVRGGAPGVSACQPWQAIRYSRRDTPPTISQVKGNNARRDAFCG